MSLGTSKVSEARLKDIEAAVWSDRDKQARSVAQQQVQAVAADNRARPVHGYMGRGEVRELARQRADLIRDKITGLGVASRGEFLARLGLLVGALDARPIKDQGQELAGIVARVSCRDWWTRQLWRAAVQAREAQGRATGEVCARRRQPYLTDDTVRRMLNQDAANAAILASTELENEDGQVMTLADLASVSTANPSIRRGELMTRIKGCEEWADGRQWAGLFTTNTTPSRFHATTHTGATNPKWIEAGKPTPKDGQKWLCQTWARCRAAMGRQGLKVFGIRVAEPHQDGTPHWHMLVWCMPGQRAAVEATMRRYWLKDEPNEPGAQAHRFKCKAMLAGGAAGYVAKYISKGIDDAGSVARDGHNDDLPDGRRITMEQGDMFGGGAARVAMWARAHGIRQFQGIGMPPVTVWRELRRVGQDAASVGTDRVLRAWYAAQRQGDKRASWAGYMEQQGGACMGRQYALELATEDRQTVGRYETSTKAVPVGVVDRHDAKRALVPSKRKQWKPRGTWERQEAGPMIVGVMNVSRAREMRAGWARPQAAQTRTRVNNCTGHAVNPVERGEPNHRNEDGRTNTRAHRLPNMRHSAGNADHTRQEWRPVWIL